MTNDKYQGKEITVTLQAPTPTILDQMLEDLNCYTVGQGLDELKVLEKGQDPDGGYRAIVVAHNFNPVTWLSEKGYRTYLGARHGVATGKAKAKIKHEIGLKGELGSAYAFEKGLQESRTAEALTAGREQAKIEAAEALERKRLLRETGRRTTEVPKAPETFEDLNKFIFG